MRKTNFYVFALVALAQRLFEYSVGVTLTAALFFFSTDGEYTYRANPDLSQNIADAFVTWNLFYIFTGYPIVVSAVVAVFLSRLVSSKVAFAIFNCIVAMLYVIGWIVITETSYSFGFWIVWGLMGVSIFLNSLFVVPALRQ